MSKVKPTIPKGMRDFGPQQVAKRQYIIDIIKGTFKSFGFMPLETPTMENLSVLTGKYGEEGDQLLFKVLNSGDYLSKASSEEIEGGSKKLLPRISEKGLRYDLTIPFARYVSMNRNDIAFPFKRFQIQPVWRADRPQKGRYREFYQCDADVIGSNSLLSEAEIIMMMQNVFGKLGIDDYTIKINNRKVLQGLAEVLGIENQFVDLTVAIDKLDKIGIDKVLEELAGKGLNNEALNGVKTFLSSTENTDLNARVNSMKEITQDNTMANKGLEELQSVLEFSKNMGADNSKVSFDPTLARGLNYYTGCIFEVSVNNVQMGSISGGGRYDDLTSSFGLPDVSGVGFSFGLDRIYDVMSELELFPKTLDSSTQLLFIALDEDSFNYSIPLLSKCRNAGVSCELYPDIVKMKKSMSYANNKNIPYVVLIGSNEMESGQLTLKNMESGEQQQLSIDQILEELS